MIASALWTLLALCSLGIQIQAIIESGRDVRWLAQLGLTAGRWAGPRLMARQHLRAACLRGYCTLGNAVIGVMSFFLPTQSGAQPASVATVVIIAVLLSNECVMDFNTLDDRRSRRLAGMRQLPGPPP